jgi:high affinity sulfate transporter 1
VFAVNGVSKYVPILGWLPDYERANLRYDVIAGVTVSALVIPKALGYAGIAQVPLEAGLYAAAAGAILYALFGTCRQISTGPSSALAAVAASTVAVTGVSGDDIAALVAGVTMAAGLAFLAMAVFRMGWISHFLSKPVITGFLFGAALEVVVGELPKMSGTDSSGDNSWQKLASWIDTIGEFHRPSFVVAMIALVTILVLRFAAPKVPGALVLVVAGLVASRLFDLAGRGIDTVGDVPRGLPAPAVPSLELISSNASEVVVAAVALVLIGFSQTAGDARTFAARHSYRIDVDQESVAQGMSNVGAGLFQGMPVSTSLSASSLNDASGARTPVASLVTGVVVLLTLLVLAPLFSDLPKPVLSALIVDAVVFGMMDVAEMKRLWRVKRVDFWIALAAIVQVLSVGVLAGVVVGIVLSMAWLIYVSTRPEMPVLGRQPGTSAFRPLELHPDGETYSGILVIRIDGNFFFVTTDTIEDRLREAVLGSVEPIEAVVIDFAGVNFIDSQGSADLGRMATLAEQAGISLRLARVAPAVMDVLQADGIVDQLGEDRCHPNVDLAVKACLGERTSRSTTRTS